VFGYLNASWTLRADINADYVCRVLNHMRETGTDIAVPVLTEEERAQIEDDDIFDFSSGYIQRSKHIMPKNAKTWPWRLNQEYVKDRKIMRESPIEDGRLTFSRAGEATSQTEKRLETTH